jgi:SAM-dependent methyltransferase
MTSSAGDPMEAEFDTVAGWTAQVARGLGPDYYVPAACRGSGQPAALDWLLSGLALRPGDRLIDAGAGMGGPAAYAGQRSGVRPVLAEPEPDACRAARQLFGLPVVQGDATRLPFAEAVVPAAWCLGVLCTTSGPAAQLAVLRELGRVVRPGGRIGLLVFLATVRELDDPPEGNHFPSPDALVTLLGEAGLTVLDRAPEKELPSPSPHWREHINTVEAELDRRYQSNPAWTTAQEQHRRIGHLLKTGELEAQVVLVSNG